MVSRKFLPRLSQADVEALMRAHLFIVQADQALQTTNWAGAGACRTLIGNADVVITALWNKVERAIKGTAAAESTEKPQDASEASSSGTEAAAPEIAPPGKEGI